MPRDAEAWLAERGVERRPMRLTPTADELSAAERTEGSDGAARDAPRGSEGGGAGDERTDRDARSSASTVPSSPEGTANGGHGPDPSVREARLLAEAAARAEADRALTEAGQRPVGGPSLADDAADALAFVRRSTANAPQSVDRLRSKLRDRGTPDAAIELALERAHAERLVDDAAMAEALVDEGRRKGHAPRRIRADLERRRIARDTIEAALAVTDGEDLEAVAFDQARQRAERLTTVAPETAVRRIVGQLARRGFPEGLARKVAREAVFTARDAERAAGR